LETKSLSALDEITKTWWCRRFTDER